MYCHNEWMIVLRVAVCTPNRRARRGSNLNCEGSWFNMNIIVHFTSRSPFLFLITTFMSLRPTCSFHLEAVRFLRVLLTMPLNEMIIWSVEILWYKSYFIKLLRPLLTLSSSMTSDLKKVLNLRFVLPDVASGLFLLFQKLKKPLCLNFIYLFIASCSSSRPSTRSSQLPVEFACCGLAG